MADDVKDEGDIYEEEVGAYDDLGDTDVHVNVKENPKVIQFTSKPSESPKPKKVKKTRTLKCPFCEEMFYEESKSPLECHLTRHHIEYRDSPAFLEAIRPCRTCSYCGKTFSSYRVVKKHQVESHAESITHTCTICGNSYTSDRSYHTHMKEVHRGGERVSCELCGKSMQNKYRLKGHMKDFHSGNSFQCSDCGATCKTERALKDHRDRKHLKLYSVTCELCSKDFGSRTVLKQHINAVHDKLKPYICNLCGHAVSSMPLFYHHRKKNHKDTLDKAKLKQLIESGEHPYCPTIPEGF